MKHEAFDIRNPNKVRSLVGVFSNQNHINFHAKSGEGFNLRARVWAARGTVPK